MAYFYEDWKHKKLTVEDENGQFFFNFAEAENSMINNLQDAIINLTEGASDEKRMGINYLEYLVDCLKQGKVQVKWNIS